MAHAYTVNSKIRDGKYHESSYLKARVQPGQRVVVRDDMKETCDKIPWLEYEGEANDRELPTGLRSGGMVVDAPEPEPAPDTDESEDPGPIGDGILEALEGKSPEQIEAAHDRATLDRIAEEVFEIDDPGSLSNKLEVAKAIHRELSIQED